MKEFRKPRRKASGFLRGKQLGFALPIAILIVVVLIAAGGAGYYFYETSQEQKEAEVAKPEQVIDETADWKIYQNKEYRYEVKYPQNWKIIRLGGVVSDFGQLSSLWVQSDEYSIGPYVRRDSLIVNTWDSSFYSYDLFLKDLPPGIDADTIKEKEIILDQEPATELAYTIVGDAGSGAREGKRVFIQKDQLVWTISCDSKKCDKILSTFKFGAEKAIETSRESFEEAVTAEKIEIYPGAFEIKLPPNLAKEIRSDLSPNTKITVFSSKDSVEKIKNWYESQLTDKGWKKIAEKYKVVVWKKDAIGFGVNLTPDDEEKTTILLVKDELEVWEKFLKILEE